MKKGERYNTWKNRYCVLKGHNLYWMRSASNTVWTNSSRCHLGWRLISILQETKIKGYTNVTGYKITPDEDIKPGNYGFKMEHPNDKTHMFYSVTQSAIREWMKALMKSTIERDYSSKSSWKPHGRADTNVFLTEPVSSTATVPTIPLDVAQAMSPPPRPPSPGSRAATQRAMRRPDPNKLSSRDAQVLLLGAEKVKGDVKENSGRVESFFPGDHIPSPIEIAKSDSYDTSSAKPPKSAGSIPPPRPSRNRQGSITDSGFVSPSPASTYHKFSNSAQDSVAGEGLIDWANGHLPSYLQFTDICDCSGLNLLRIAESIHGKPASPPVLNSSFPSGPNDDKLDGLFSLFDFLLNNDVRLGTVSINDIRLGKIDKIVQLLKALKSWEDRRIAVSRSLRDGSGPKPNSSNGMWWFPAA